jgi:predicted nucleic acid-binding protein
MIVVSDAGPLHYLILIGQIELLLPQVLDQLQQANFCISPAVLQSVVAQFQKPEQ